MNKFFDDPNLLKLSSISDSIVIEQDRRNIVGFEM